MMVKRPERDFYPYTWNAIKIVVIDVNGEVYQGTHLTLDKLRHSMLLYGYLFYTSTGYSSTGEWLRGMKMLDVDCIKEIKVFKREHWYNIPIPEQKNTLISVELTDGAKKLVSIREFARIIRRFPETLARSVSTM